MYKKLIYFLHFQYRKTTYRYTITKVAADLGFSPGLGLIFARLKVQEKSPPRAVSSLYVLLNWVGETYWKSKDPVNISTYKLHIQRVV
jgi:hypothetical protein